MTHYNRFLFALSLATLALCLSAFSQSQPDNSADTSGALAAIQAKQNSASPSTQNQQTFPALKAQSCKEAVSYVESPDGLLGQWDKAMGRHAAYKQGIANTDEIKKQLLSSAYWRTSTAADAANDVRTFCKLTEHTLALLMPGGAPLKNAIDMSEDFGAEVSRDAVHVYELIEKGDAVKDVLNSSVDELTVWGTKEAAKKAGYGRVIAALDLLEDTEKYRDTAKAAADYKSLVQERVQHLDIQMNQFRNGMDMESEKLLTIEALKDAVIAACNQGRPIQTAPEFASGYVQQQPAVQQEPVSSSEPNAFQQPAKPWWATLSSIQPVVTRSTRRIQGKATQNSTSGQQSGPCEPDGVGPGGNGCPHH